LKIEAGMNFKLWKFAGRAISVRVMIALAMGCVAGVYLLSGMFVYGAQRSMLYFPTIRTREQVDEGLARANLQRWIGPHGQFIGLRRNSPIQPAQGTVLITYGNGSSAVGCGRYATDIQKAAAFDVFILEYPGYQDRAGKPTQTSLFNAADEAFQSLPTNSPIYLVGESLGSSVASRLAGTYSNRIAGAILISPFDNLTDVAQSHMVIYPVKWMLRDHFASDEYLRNYHGKVGIAVDGRDFTVPERFGRRLFDGYAGSKKLWEFPEGGHIHIEQPAVFWREAVAFLQE
jgi:pimeloyl-ACP methyl ester carboxylesterase